MNKKIVTFQYIKNFNEQSATLFLALLLCADFMFIALHSISDLTPYLNNEFFYLGNDAGYPEFYQYIKWLWIIILLIHISKIRGSFRYVTWALVFTYFLFDDALRLHEIVGDFIERNLDLSPPFGLRLQDIGELVVSASVGMILLSFVTLAYLNGEEAFKKMSQDMLLLILALVFFGVGVDMAHVAIKLGWKVRFVLGVIEDGGEMVIASLILWYVFFFSARDANRSSYICDCIRIVLARHST
jgi:hypothetical protein